MVHFQKNIKAMNAATRKYIKRKLKGGKSKIGKSLSAYKPSTRKWHEICLPNTIGTQMIATTGGTIVLLTATTTRLTNTLAGLTDSIFSFTFCFNQLSQVVAGYFNSATAYRIDKVQIKLYPSVTMGGFGPQGQVGLANNPPSRFYTLIDHNDNATSGNTVQSLRLNPSTKEHYFNGNRTKPYVFTVRPKPGTAMFNASTGLSTQNAVISNKTWINLLSSNVPYYGFKLAIPIPQTPATQLIQFDAEVEVFYETKYI